MPWFKIDDSAHSHPKFLRAGNAALGLWMRCGSYSAQHLLEGAVPKAVAKAFGSPAQIRKLVVAGLWHEAGHDCKRCPQPAEGYMIHDFFEGGRNTTKAQHEANKKSAAERAAKSRATKKPPQSARDLNENDARNEAIRDENEAKNEPHFSGSAAGQEGLSHRTPADGVTHTHAAAMPYPRTSSGSTGPASSEHEQRRGLPDAFADLKKALASAGLGAVGWDIRRESDWQRIKSQLDRLGVDLMVKSALNSARLQGEPANATAWIKRWQSLEDPQPDAQPPGNYLPAAVGDNVHQLRPSTTDQRVANGMALTEHYRQLEAQEEQ
jgi:hypothetical protein